jgi:predicted transcriptional regulator
VIASLIASPFISRFGIYMMDLRRKSGSDQRHEISTSSVQQNGDVKTALVRELGQREQEIMRVLWKRGSVSVAQVAESLSITLAYTTVMTTLDRLFKKGLLNRHKQDRAFVYSPAITPGEVERQRAARLVQGLFAGSRERPELLVSCLVDAVNQYDSGLLDELESKIRSARLEIEKSNTIPENLP